MGGGFLQKRRLGQTELMVSPIGLGTVKFGRNQNVKYPQTFSLPDDKMIADLLVLCSDLGINLLDTAPAYGESETRLGKMLRKKRHQFVIVSKAGERFIDGQSYFDFSQRAIIESIDQSLKNLQTDYIDVLLIHSNGDDISIIEHDRVFETLRFCQQSGKIRAFGMSTKTIDGGLLTIDQADCAMVTFHRNETHELPIIQAAAKKGKGVLVKKPFASGHLLASTNVRESLAFILKEPGVTSVIMGTINPIHLKENASSINTFGNFPDHPLFSRV